jgi:hypothetical protein
MAASGNPVWHLENEPGNNGHSISDGGLIVLFKISCPCFNQSANKFDVIIIEPWQKLGILNTDFNRLCQEHPNTIRIVIFQPNAGGGMRSGVAVCHKGISGGCLSCNMKS